MEKQEIQRLLGDAIFARAQRYYARGRVHHFTEEESAPGVLYLTATVRGTDSYSVRVWLTEEGDFKSASCTCPYNENGFGAPCKHVGAVLLQYAENKAMHTAPGLSQLMKSDQIKRGSQIAAPSRKPVDFHEIYEGTPFADDAPPQHQRGSYSNNLEMLFGRKWRGDAAVSDEGARQLLAAYQLRAERDSRAPRPDADVLEETMALEPELLLDELRNDCTPELRLRVTGGGRWYVVKDLPSFCEALANEDVLDYGKSLHFTQRLDAYEPTSRRLLELVCRQVNMLSYAKDVVTASSRLRTITGNLPLAPETAEALLELYRPTGWLGRWGLREGLPPITITVQKSKGGVSLSAMPHLRWFRGQTGFYYYSAEAIWRVTPAQHRSLEPLLTRLTGKELYFTHRDAMDFCSYVMPEVSGAVKLNDPEHLLLDHLPLPPVVQFYLDAPQQLRVVASPAFVYGEDTVDLFNPPPAGLLRDNRAERAAIAALNRYFTPCALPEERGRFEAEGEQAVLELMENGLPALMQQGEVYLSEAFRSLEAPRPKISVGISVSGSVLDLTVDTGEFPAGELKALLASLRQKKRYHRLNDGRLLRLNEELQGLEALEELDDTLQLSGSEWADGHATLPLYRAPSLDRTLAGRKQLQFRRDDAFRAISRSFHSVADSDYALPASLNGILRKYQRTGYRWLRTLDGYRMGGILADDMGLGKTVQVLAYLLAIKQERKNAGLPSLIVCPASLVLNWAEECARFTPELKCLVVDGSAAQRARLAEEFDSFDLVVTGYDLLRRDGDLYANRRFYACILDEAQAIKNHTTQKYKAVCRVDSVVRFALTGTPIENRLSELWSIFSFLMPGYLYSYPVFREKLERPIVQEGGAAEAERLNRMTAPFILRRMKSEVLTELPPKTESVQKIAMEEQQRRLYVAAVVDAREKLRAIKEEDRVQVFAVLTRLRQICCDPRLMAENWAGPSAKLEACVELVASAVENGHQILLFSQFTGMLELVRQRLDELEISHFTLQGSTPKPVRAELVRRFNNHEASVFLISLKAGGTGLNLTAADIVIHYDPWWNVAAQNQATDRAYRIGQKKSVQVYKLIAQDTIEEKILQLQEAKQALAESITGSAEGSIMAMSREEILALLD